VDPRSSRRVKLRTIFVIGVGAVLLAVTLFEVPLATILLIGLWLVCPLMMMGMRGKGHGRLDSSAPGREARRDPDERPPAGRGDPGPPA
jgi:hypothetical protein